MFYVKALLAAAAFLIGYSVIEWLAGVTAPVLGPIFLLGSIVFLFWLLGVLYRAGK